MDLKNILEKELKEGNFYQLFLSLNLGKINTCILNAETQKELDFYNKLHELVLQTKQVELIEKGVF